MKLYYRFKQGYGSYAVDKREPLTPITFALSLVASRWSMLAFCLLAFAANSLLCRSALFQFNLDPLLFTNLRLLSGGLILVLLSLLLVRLTIKQTVSLDFPVLRLDVNGERSRVFSRVFSRVLAWQGGFYLFIYMLGFSLAYQQLATGTGALLLFGAVQMTMTLIGFYRRQLPTIKQWFGWSIALCGLLWLVLPKTESDPSSHSLFDVFWMVVAGVGWGLYSAYGQVHRPSPAAANTTNPDGAMYRLLGHATAESIRRTRNYFLQAGLFIVMTTTAVLLTQPQYAQLLEQQLYFANPGLWLAVVSGAITSALGYILWYRVLPSLTTLEAASSQLLVPMIAVALGILILAEPLTNNFIIASALAIGGLALVVLAKKPVR